MDDGGWTTYDPDPCDNSEIIAECAVTSAAFVKRALGLRADKNFTAICRLKDGRAFRVTHDGIQWVAVWIAG